MAVKRIIYLSLKLQKRKFPTGKCKKAQNISVINGLAINAGQHFNYIIDALYSVFEKFYSKTVGKDSRIPSEAVMCHYFNLVIIAAIPGLEWGGGQTKTTIAINDEDLAAYKLQKGILEEIAETITMIIINESKGNKRTTRSKKSVYADSYKTAKFSGVAGKSHQCTLLISEGLSANTTMNAAVKGIKTFRGLGGDYYATWTLGGKTVNARKNSKIIASKKDKVIIRNTMLDENVKWAEFMEILNLNYNLTYQSDEEFKSLRYGRVIACTDQDLDGFDICATVLSNIYLFWPALIERGFFCKFDSPLIRAYPKGADQEKSMKQGKCHTFYSFGAFDEFEKNNDVSKFDMIYCKGLGRHEPHEVCQMFSEFNQHVIAFTCSDASEAVMESYYGKDSEPRKLFLSTALIPRGLERQREVELNLNLQAEEFCHYEIKEYKLLDLSRKLPCNMDGLNLVGRKVLAGAIKAAKSKGVNKRWIVSAMAAYVKLEMNYHFGDTPIQDAIVKQAQCYPGAERYPYLIPHGNFGTREYGGTDAASPRYINTRLNHKLAEVLFPDADKYLLSYVFVEGERSEPVYFLPVLPMAVLKYKSLPGQGWKIDCWDRNLDEVYNLVCKLIKSNGKNNDEGSSSAGKNNNKNNNDEGNNKSPTDDLSPETYGFDMEVRSHKQTAKAVASQHFFSAYEWKAATNTLIIKELPPTVATDTYIKKYLIDPSILQKMERKKVAKGKPVKAVKVPKTSSMYEYIESYDDNSTDENVNIIVKLKPGAFDTIKSKFKGPNTITALEHAFKLHLPIQKALNFIHHDGSVKSYDKYRDIVSDWFEQRRNLYTARYNRERIILEIQLEYLEELLRATLDLDTKSGGKLVIAKLTEKVAYEKLASAGYKRFNVAVVNNPKYLEVDKIRQHAIAEPNKQHPGKGLLASITYNYILNLRQRDLLSTKIDELRAEIESKRRQLEDLIARADEKPFIGAKIWQQEAKQAYQALLNARDRKF
jgi:hypothetical protein